MKSIRISTIFFGYFDLKSEYSSLKNAYKETVNNISKN